VKVTSNRVSRVVSYPRRRKRNLPGPDPRLQVLWRERTPRNLGHDVPRNLENCEPTDHSGARRDPPPRSMPSLAARSSAVDLVQGMIRAIPTTMPRDVNHVVGGRQIDARPQQSSLRSCDNAYTKQGKAGENASTTTELMGFLSPLHAEMASNASGRRISASVIAANLKPAQNTPSLLRLALQPRTAAGN